MSEKKVCLIYTGGTFGALPIDPSQPTTALRAGRWEEIKPFVSPVLTRLGFDVDVIETREPIDSSNVSPLDWVEVVELIQRNYEAYTGFVIIHGTDTLAYMASAISFGARDLNKPIVTTGAQLPLAGRLRTDAVQNLVTALMIANPEQTKIPRIPEVCVYFGGKIMRGSRVTKFSSVDFEAFRSPNYPQLGNADLNIVVDTSKLLAGRVGNPKFNTKLESRVVPYFISPGVDNGELFPSMVESLEPQGVVLLSYGAGNVPLDSGFLSSLDAAVQSGIIIGNVTQCPRGSVDQSLYEVGTQLIEVGVVDGHDMTTEAALCKLMWLLGDTRLSSLECERLFSTNLVGELTAPLTTAY